MKPLKQMLDELFAEARDNDPTKFKTIADEAKFLNMSVSHWSRLRNQRVPLTDDVIERIVGAFVESGDEAERAKLRRQLMLGREAGTPKSSQSASKEVNVAQGAVKEFFERYAGPGNLLCCEYRDRPQVNDIKGAFPSIAEDAARAVAAGMSYAFFQPFGKLEQIVDAISECAKKNKDTAGLRYLLDVATEVRSSFMKVKSLAEEMNPQIQIALYEADRKHIEVSGLQARLFYIDYPSWGTKERERKIYQWIAGVDSHYFIEREKESISVGALAQQFLPVTAYWAQNNALPMTDEELQDASEKCGGTVKWSIWKLNAHSAKAK